MTIPTKAEALEALIDIRSARNFGHQTAAETIRAFVEAQPEKPREPDGYLYEYPTTDGRVTLSMEHGERNGSRPIRGRPYFLDNPPSTPDATPAQAGKPEPNPDWEAKAKAFREQIRAEAGFDLDEEEPF